MAAHDGTISINTKISTAGVNQGTQQIGKAIEKNIAKPTQSLTKSLGGILNVIRGIGKALIAAFVGGAILNAIQNIVQEFDFLTGSTGPKFKALSDSLEKLKGAFVNLLVQAILPMIPSLIELVNFLTESVQWVTQLVAAIFGFESTVGGIMTKAAAGAKKAAKEAKGALASFDQINVLQKKEAPETPEGPTATPEPITVIDEILKKVAALKKLWEEFLKDPLKVLAAAVIVFIEELTKKWREFIEWVRDNLPFGDVLADVLTIIGNVLKKLVINALETFLKIKENIIQVFTGIKEFLVGVFTGDWALAWEGLKEIVTGIFGALFAFVEGAINSWLILFGGLIDTLAVIFAPVIEFLAEMFEKIKAKIGDAIQGVMTAFSGLAKWFFENVWNPIEAGFGSALTGIKQGFQKTFDGIKTLVKGIINTIIDYINGMIEGIVFGINTVIGSANAVSGLVGLPEIQSVTAPKIPRLATGAVIPPNSEFLAVLGDQKSGKNIEAPAAMFEQMLERAIQSAAGGEITVTMPVYLDGEKIYENQQRVSRRRGKSLIASGITR